jgi:DNA-binding transcriptional MerR regulator
MADADSGQAMDGSDDRSLTIGALARLTRTNPAIIREYEALGLLPPPYRPGEHLLSSAGGPRIYDESDVRRLLFLRRSRDLGILNPGLKLLVGFIDDPANVSEAGKDFARNVLENSKDQIHELSELTKVLEALLLGEGPRALELATIDATPIKDMKRMRRLLRKPLRTPKST